MLHHLDVAKTIPGHECVLDVAIEIVGLISNTGDAALGPIGIRIGTGLLGHNGDGMASLRQIEREAQAADATPDDDCLIMGRH